MQTVDTLLNIAANMNALWAGVGSVAAVSAVGMLPRVGFRRAVTLALKSKLFNRPSAVSVRTAEKDLLLTEITLKEAGKYLVVMGPKGVGKTCLVQSALSGRSGVVTISVSHLPRLRAVFDSRYFR